MFSYRHGFHAGNHADVLKHTVLAQVLSYFRLKDAPFWGIDTHAGAGLYDLAGDWANKKAEYVDGVARVWAKMPGGTVAEDSLPDVFGPWLEVLKRLNPDGQMRLYPGSPWLWLDGWRTQDRLKLIEHLPVEAEVLRRNLDQRRDLPPRAVQVLDQDGFETLKAFLPPTTRRGIVLMDPSYEDKHDYQRVTDTVRDAITRFPTGTYMIWYPRVNRLQVEQMRRQLRKIAATNWLDVEMTVSKPPLDGHGLFGSGCFLINPPYTLEPLLRSAMPWLTKTLAQDETARWSIETGDGKAQDDSKTHPTKSFKATNQSRGPSRMPGSTSVLSGAGQGSYQRKPLPSRKPKA